MNKALRSNLLFPNNVYPPLLEQCTDEAAILLRVDAASAVALMPGVSRVDAVFLP